MESEAATRAVQILEQLSDKIGAKAADAWPHYVNYVRLQAWAGLAEAVFVSLMAVAFVWYGLRHRSKIKDEPTCEGIVTITILAIGMVLVLAAVIVGSKELSSAIPTLMDPEGAALRSLLSK